MAVAERNYLFDMGTKTSPVKEGYLRVTPGDIYSSQRGYGWVSTPVGAFDTLYNRIADTLFRDGVRGKGKLVFKVKVVPGTYFVTITAGSPDSARTEVQVSMNNQISIGRVTTPWYRLPYRSMRKKVVLKDQEAIFEISSPADFGLHSLELRAVAPEPAFTISAGPDIDIAELDRLQKYLVSRRGSQSERSKLTNAVDMLEKLSRANWFFALAGWSESLKKTKMNQIQRMYAAVDLLDQLVADPSGPLYYKSLYLLGKIHFWLVKEDDNLLVESRAREIFDELAHKFPDHQIVAMYQGKQIEDPYEPKLDKSKAPAWAVLQQEAVSRMLSRPTMVSWAENMATMWKCCAGGCRPFWGPTIRWPGKVIPKWPTASGPAENWCVATTASSTMWSTPPNCSATRTRACSSSATATRFMWSVR
jgi:hypothetical protein